MIRFNRTIIVDRVPYQAGDEVNEAELTPGHLTSLLEVGDVERFDPLEVKQSEKKPESTVPPVVKPATKK